MPCRLLSGQLSSSSSDFPTHQRLVCLAQATDNARFLSGRKCMQELGTMRGPLPYPRYAAGRIAFWAGTPVSHRVRQARSRTPTESVSALPMLRPSRHRAPRGAGAEPARARGSPEAWKDSAQNRCETAAGPGLRDKNQGIDREQTGRAGNEVGRPACLLNKRSGKFFLGSVSPEERRQANIRAAQWWC